MPLFDYRCDQCNQTREVLIRGSECPTCETCGFQMRRLPAGRIMIKMKGMGGYPSKQKLVRGSAPYTGGVI